MSIVGLLFVSTLLLGSVALYLAIDRETSEPEVLKRSEAEQIARDRGGRPSAREGSGAGSARDSDDSGEWGASEEWGDRR